MPERGFTLKSALISLGAAVLFIAGLAIVVYVSVARDRIGPTPTPRPTRAPTATSPAPILEITAVTATTEPLDTVAGVVREYAPGALIIVITPREGTAEQIIVPENIEVVWSSGQRASPREVAAGQVLYAEGHLDALGRLVAQRLVIIQAAPRLTATMAPSPSQTAVPVVPVQAWVGEYWGNMTLAGKPTLTRYDAAIDFNWQQSAPAPSLPENGFSVRWRGRWPMEQGTYVFYALSDDGVRVWVDGVVVIDAWRDQSPTQLFGEIDVARGEHVVQVEYYENAEGAQIQLWWELKDAFTNWKGEYYPNTRLEGQPVLTRNDSNVSFDWGTAAPAPQVPADNFSVRWTRSITVEEGAYRFKSRSDDGVRVWVDDRLLIDAWRESSPDTYEGYIWMTAAAHQVRIEYYEGAGSANVHVWWERIGAFAQWRGEYLANPDLIRPPMFVRNDFEILFDWRQGSPGFGMPADNFSVRWTRRMTFEAGDYVFWTVADDGVRLYVDDVLLINEWHDSSAQRHEARVRLTAGEHVVVVEYYERGNDATIQMAWEMVVPTPTATLSPSPSLTSTRTATATPIPPTATATVVPSTVTSVPPTATTAPTATVTPLPPTPTDTVTITPTPETMATDTPTPTTAP